ncbi:hypothetical protein D9V34_03615 [Mycetocola lacteus]|uniref:Uncharacterized protein n=1 Tax=Mycetocola lacteus TaxID=76637 RepID=A0A3L7ATZ4_9MICO|nr:hypothetical protein D9V34_03615 [Mycetocola lacteus]
MASEDFRLTTFFCIHTHRYLGQGTLHSESQQPTERFELRFEVLKFGRSISLQFNQVACIGEFHRGRTFERGKDQRFLWRTLNTIARVIARYQRPVLISASRTQIEVIGRIETDT